MNNLVFASREIGSRLDLVQAAGGNTSVKQEGKIYVKASGFNLCDVSHDKGFSELSLNSLQEMLIDLASNSFNYTKKELEQKGKDILSQAVIADNTARPSIETFLHSFGNKYTIHTHPSVVSVYCSANSLFNKLSDIFPGAYLVDYATPGVELFLKVYDSVFSQVNDSTPKIIFLKNHGLIVSCDDHSQAISLTYNIVDTLSEKLGLDNTQYKVSSRLINDIYTVFNEDLVVKNIDDKSLVSELSRLANKEIFAFSPDISVFLGGRVCNSNLQDLRNDLISYYEHHREIPSIVKIDEAVYVIGNKYQQLCEKIDVARFYCQVMSYLVDEDDRSSLSSDEVSYLKNWDSEKFRKQV